MQGSFSKLFTFMLVPSYTSSMVEEALIFCHPKWFNCGIYSSALQRFLKNHSPWKVVEVQTTIERLCPIHISFLLTMGDCILVFYNVLRTIILHGNFWKCVLKDFVPFISLYFCWSDTNSTTAENNHEPT